MSETPTNDSDLIYHYCSAESFMKIVESNSLLTSPITMMNDYSEMTYFQRFAAPEL